MESFSVLAPRSRTGARVLSRLADVLEGDYCQEVRVRNRSVVSRAAEGWALNVEKSDMPFVVDDSGPVNEEGDDKMRVGSLLVWSDADLSAEPGIAPFFTFCS